MNQQNIQLQLTLEDANLILESLGQLPFKQVFQLIGKIQEQANGQLNPNKEDHSTT